MSLANAYAKTLLDAGKTSDSKDFVEKTLAFMKAKGHLSLLPQIVKIIEQTPENANVATVVVAKESDGQKFKSRIDASLKTLGAIKRQTLVDARIVGGYSIRFGSHSIDNSFRNTLVSLYKESTRA